MYTWFKHGFYVVKKAFIWKTFILVTALAVEAEPAIAKTHQLNHPHIPIVEMRVQNTKQTLSRADESLRAEAFLEEGVGAC